MKLLVILPCLNEEKTLKHVIESIPSSLEGISSLDILIINDGSTDNSCAVAEAAGAFVISHRTNLGVGRAFRSGLDYAISNSYDIMVSIKASSKIL